MKISVLLLSLFLLLTLVYGQVVNLSKNVPIGIDPKDSYSISYTLDKANDKVYMLPSIYLTIHTCNYNGSDLMQIADYSHFFPYADYYTWVINQNVDSYGNYLFYVNFYKDFGIIDNEILFAYNPIQQNVSQLLIGNYNDEKISSLFVDNRFYLISDMTDFDAGNGTQPGGGTLFVFESNETGTQLLVAEALGSSYSVRNFVYSPSMDIVAFYLYANSSKQIKFANGNGIIESFILDNAHIPSVSLILHDSSQTIIAHSISGFSVVDLSNPLNMTETFFAIDSRSYFMNNAGEFLVLLDNASQNISVFDLISMKYVFHQELNAPAINYNVYYEKENSFIYQLTDGFAIYNLTSNTTKEYYPNNFTVLQVLNEELDILIYANAFGKVQFDILTEMSYFTPFNTSQSQNQQFSFDGDYAFFQDEQNSYQSINSMKLNLTESETTSSTESTEDTNASQQTSLNTDTSTNTDTTSKTTEEPSSSTILKPVWYLFSFVSILMIL